MLFTGKNPLLTLPCLLAVGLALSIGWGIRGNYGHEIGAMLPGALAAIAACVLSGREDWRRRVAYFALFGAIGWGFGGSISYMVVISYTHSGDIPDPEHAGQLISGATNQLYGFYCLFAIGFLWAGVGGAATALPASLEHRKLVDLVWAFVSLFAIWVLLYFVEERLSLLVENGQDSMTRHADMLYWLDSDWLPVTCILVGILLFDLVQRKFGYADLLVLLAGIGAAVGFGFQYLLAQQGLTDDISKALFHPQGDVTLFDPSILPTNWPNFLPHMIPYLGWSIGLIVGIAIYFSIFGKFRYGSLLYLYMAVGWWVGFLALPVLANVHMTPPRGDNWAGVAGVLLGAWVYFLRERLWSVLLASIVCGTIGGIGFSGIAWLKLWLVSLGNPNLVSDPEIVEAWQHWQHANWHSFLEQSYGFINGIGVALALGLLARRVPPLATGELRRKWAEIFAIVFVLPVLLYVTMTKNIHEWTKEYGGHRPIPEELTAPLFSNFTMSPMGWYTLFFWSAAGVMILLLIVHGRRRSIAVLPESWLGRGQLLFLAVLWTFVIGNFMRTIVAFHEQRLLTEGGVFLNACIVTALVLAFASPTESIPIKEKPRWGIAIALSILFGGLIAYFLPQGETMHIRHVYKTDHGVVKSGHAGDNYRFGPNADWKVRPNRKDKQHR